MSQLNPLQQQIYTVLQQNSGNRLTLELINGLTARLQAIVNEHIEQTKKEKKDA